MWEQIYLNSFTLPSMKASVIGYMEDLHTLRADDLRAWYKQFYAPNNAVLVIVGDVDAKQTLRTAAGLFGKIPRKSLPERNNLKAEPVKRAPSFAQASSPVTRQPLVAISWRAPALSRLNDKLPYALDVLTDVLAGNTSSRLDKNLVRGKQTALSANAHYDLLSREMPLFGVFGMPAENVSAETLLTQMKSEIKDIADNGISKEELDRIKAQALAGEIYARDSMVSQASLMGRLEARGFKYSDEAAIRHRIQAVTAEEVQKAAQMLTDDRSSTVIIMPESAPPAPADYTAVKKPEKQ